MNTVTANYIPGISPTQDTVGNDEVPISDQPIIDDQPIIGDEVVTDTPPTLSIPSGSTAYTGSEILVSPDLTITDPDTGDTLNGSTVLISTNFNSTTDRLSIDGQSGTEGTVGSIAWSFDTSTGALTLSGTASTADYQSALRQVTFDTTGTLAEAPRTVDITLGENLANSDNGHFYEFVSAQSIEWENARDAAAERTYFGLQGYLTTVTSAVENEFLESKIQGQGWMGASDEAVEGEWRWVTGPEAGDQFWQGDATGGPVNGQYNNWSEPEPNDLFGEDHGHFLVNGTWNDYRFDNESITGYVVEYGGLSGDPTLNLTGSVTIGADAVSDLVAPSLQSITANGNSLVLTYDEALDGTSGPEIADFAVNVNGSAATVNSVNVDGSTIIVTLAAAVAALDTVTTSYTPGSSPIQDAAGNDAVALSERAVTNDSVSPTLPDIVFTFDQYVEFQQVQKGISPTFDEELYLLANPDVEAAVAQGSLSSGLQHYNQVGQTEGRSLLPLDLEIGGLRMADFVDEAYYLQTNPDVAAAVEQGAFANGFEHFLRFGIAEGRNPSSFYNEEQYLELNPDVKAAVDSGALSSGLSHFIQDGHIENRTPSDLFDAGDYLLQNPDVQTAVEQGGFASAFEHYLEVGASEARLPGLLFAEEDYLTQYSDVAEAVAVGDFDSGFEHYITFGIGENRSISSQFDNSTYLSANSDVAGAIGNGLSSGFEHYFQNGRFEGRLLSASF